MRITTVLSVLMLLSIGCGGASKQQVAELETSLEQCKTEHSAKVAELEGQLAEARSESAPAKSLVEQRNAHFNDLMGRLGELIDAGKVNLAVRNGLIVVQIPNDLLYEAGKVDIQKDAKPVISQVWKALEPIKDRKFWVVVHEDNVAPKDKKARKFKNNWELANARAFAVHEIFLAAGMGAEESGIGTLGDADPVASNDDDAGKAKNRRTEIIVMPNVETVLPQVAAPAAEPAAEAAEEPAEEAAEAAEEAEAEE